MKAFPGKTPLYIKIPSMTFFTFIAVVYWIIAIDDIIKVIWG